MCIRFERRVVTVLTAPILQLVSSSTATEVAADKSQSWCGALRSRHEDPVAVVRVLQRIFWYVRDGHPMHVSGFTLPPPVRLWSSDKQDDAF